MTNWYLLVLAGMVGLAIGSLVNVIISRVPVMAERRLKAEAFELLCIETSEPPPLNLFYPRSHCPQCGVTLRPWHLVPLLSWIFLRGKCSNCDTPISTRYPLVEFCVCILTVVWVLSTTLGLETIALVIASSLLIALAFIDIEHGILPDELTYPLMFAGLFTCSLNLPSLYVASVTSAVIGAIVGYLSLWTINHAMRLVLGRDSMGAGDFKLHAAIGAWIGWHMIPVLVVIAFGLGVLFCIWELIRKRYSVAEGVPFGPFLVLAALATILFRQDFMALMYGS